MLKTKVKSRVLSKAVVSVALISASLVAGMFILGLESIKKIIPIDRISEEIELAVQEITRMEGAQNEE